MISPLRLESDSFLMAFATHRNLPFVTHWHPRVELVYCLDGDFIVQIEDRAYQMESGDVIAIGYCENHSFTFVENPISYYSMVFDPNILPLPSVTDQFSFILPRKHSRDWPDSLKESLRLSMLNIYEEYTQKKDGYMVAVISMLLKIQGLMIRAFADSPPANCRQIGSKGAKILEYLSAHYLEPITLASCADSMNFGRSYFSHLFKKEIGESFRATLLNLRLSKAEWLLLYTSDPIAAVVEKSGFQNEKTFYRVFRKAYGMSPTDFRRTASVNLRSKKEVDRKFHL